MSVSIPYKYSQKDVFNQFCPVTYGTDLAVGVEQTLTVPFLTSSTSYVSAHAGSSPLVIAYITASALGATFVANNASPSVPGATFGAGCGELVTPYFPMIKQVKSGDVLHFICASFPAFVNVVFYLAG